MQARSDQDVCVRVFAAAARGRRKQDGRSGLQCGRAGAGSSGRERLGAGERARQQSNKSPRVRRERRRLNNGYGVLGVRGHTTSDSRTRIRGSGHRRGLEGI